ncbi:MAG: energy transducer TonB [Rhodospirillales bacterium]|nr:energy transducer TonB [Rhodospirillales bacterium]
MSLHGLILAALIVTVSAGVIYGRGPAFTEAISVDLVFIPETVPVPEQNQIIPVTEPQQPKTQKSVLLDDIGPVLSQKQATEPQSVEQSTPVTAPRTATAKESGHKGIMPYDYRQTLVRHIEEHKYYPVAARRRGLEGEATVAFSMDPAGNLQHARVIKTSGQHILDNAALVTIRQASPYPPPPQTLEARAFELPIHFSLKR